MENLERPNYYSIIPADVRYSDISSSAKLMYGEITALTNKTGTCWASNSYFAELYKVNVETVGRWVSELTKAEFISTKIIKEQGNRRYIRLTTHKNVGTYPQKSRDINNIKNKVSKDTNVPLTKKKEELIILVNEVTGRSFRTLPSTGVKQTLDTFSLVEIKSALSALAADDWHRERIKEFNISYLIRSTTIDKFLAIANDKSTTVTSGGKVWTPEMKEKLLREQRGY